MTMLRRQSLRQATSSTSESGSQPLMGHGGRLRRANVKIQQFAAELLTPHRVGSRTHHAEESDSSSSQDSVSFENEDYASWDTNVEQARVHRLLDKLQIDRRDEVLQSVHDDLRNLALSSRRELAKLDRVERKQDRAMKEFDAAVQDWIDKLNHQEVHTRNTMDHFSRTMQCVKRVRGRLSQDQDIADDDMLMLDTKDLDAMTDEDLAAEVQIIRMILQQKEKEAREFILAESGSATDPQSDVIAEQQHMLEKMSAKTTRVDTRGYALKEILEHLIDRKRLAECSKKGVVVDENVDLSEDAAKLLAELSGAVPNRLLPKLQREREEVHGDELRPIDARQLDRVRRQCVDLSSSIHAVDQTIEKLMRPQAAEEDMQARVAAGVAGKQPGDVLADKLLEALRTISSVVEDSESETTRAGTVTLRDVAEASDKVKQDVRCGMLDQRDTVTTVVEVFKEQEQARNQFEHRQKEEKTCYDALHIFTGHHQLFTEALSLARGTPLPGTQPRLPSQATSFHGPVAVAAVASAFAEAGVANIENEDLWMEAFLMEMGDSLDEDAFEIQSNTINAFVGEERELSEEICEVENSFNSRMQLLTGKLKGGPDACLLEQVQTCVQDGRRAIQEFTSSHDDLLGIGKEVVEGVSFKHDSIEELLDARRLAVKTAGSLRATSLGSMAGSVLMDVLALEEENRAFSNHISALGDEINALRVHRAAAREDAKKKKHALKVKVELAHMKKRKQSTEPAQGEEEDLNAQLVQLNAEGDIPNSDDARKLRRERRLLGAIRAEAKALTMAKRIFSNSNLSADWRESAGLNSEVKQIGRSTETISELS